MKNRKQFDLVAKWHCVSLRAPIPCLGKNSEQRSGELSHHATPFILSLAEVPDVARENSVLHAWDIGKLCSYGLLKATDRGCWKICSDFFPFSTFFVLAFEYYHTLINPFDERLNRDISSMSFFSIPTLFWSRSYRDPGPIPIPSRFYPDPDPDPDAGPVPIPIPVLSRSYPYPDPVPILSRSRSLSYPDSSRPYPDPDPDPIPVPALSRSVS